MDSRGGNAGMPAKKPSQACQICSNNVGKFVDGEPFVACDVCSYPVCRACSDYERKEGKNACPHCKTQYKRHKGIPATPGYWEEDVEADDRRYSHGVQDVCTCLEVNILHAKKSCL